MAAYKSALDRLREMAFPALPVPKKAPVYVIVNSIESAFVAAFLAKDRTVFAVEKKTPVVPFLALYGVGEQQVQCVNAGLEALGIQQEWRRTYTKVHVVKTTETKSSEWVEVQQTHPYRGLGRTFYKPADGWESLYEALLSKCSWVLSRLPKSEIISVLDVRSAPIRQRLREDGIELQWGEKKVFEAMPYMMSALDEAYYHSTGQAAPRRYEEKVRAFRSA